MPSQLAGCKSKRRAAKLMKRLAEDGSARLSSSAAATTTGMGASAPAGRGPTAGQGVRATILIGGSRDDGGEGFSTSAGRCAAA